MTSEEFIAKTQHAYDALDTSGLAAFFHFAKPVAIEAGKDIATDLDALENRYIYLLRFLTSTNNNFVPNADLEAIENEADKIMARIFSVAYERDSTHPKSAQLKYQRMRPEENFESLVSDYLSETERLLTDTNAITSTSARVPLERLTDDIFKRLWATNPISADDLRLVETLITDNSLPGHYRVLIVAAIGLGVELHDWQSRLQLLQLAAADDYKPMAIAAQVWIIAIMSLLYGDSIRIPQLFTEDFIAKQNISLPDIEPIFHAFTRSIPSYSAPDVSKLMDIGRKMQGKSALEMPDMSVADYDAMKAFAEAQQNGDDVFEATIGRMRHFSFFNKISNWFLPFHPNNSALADVVDGEGAAIAEMITKIPGLTDGDKYALLLSMAQVPAIMRNQAMEAMIDQFRAVVDTDEYQAAIAEAAPSACSLATNAVNTIKRFKSNYSGAQKFAIIEAFKYAPLIAAYALQPSQRHFDEEFKLIRRLSAAKKYEDAIKIAELLPEAIDTDDIETAMALAKAYAATDDIFKQSQILEAIIEEYPDNREALIALSSVDLMIGSASNNAERLENYIAAHGDDAEILHEIGKSYIKAEKIDKAIEALHNADYISDNNEIKLTLARALAMAGEYASAADVVDRISLSATDPDILINKGIILWLSNSRPEALISIDHARTLMPDTPDDIFMRILKDHIESIGDNPSLFLFLEAVRYRFADNATNPDDIYDVAKIRPKNDDIPF